MADRPTNPPDPGAEEPSGRKSVSDPSERLESWKEIASYLKREVRTVQRWEKREGLPVRRHQNDRGPVFAYKAELDAWLRNRGFRPEPRPWPHWLAGAAVVVAVTAAAIYLLEFRSPPQLPLRSKDSILIANFENRTGDPVFDGTLRQGLAAQLDQSPFLHIVSDPRIAGELRLMSQPAGTRLTPDLARQVCERMGGAATLDGSIAKIGSEYSLVLEAVNCSTGASLARSEAVASDKSHVLASLGTVATSMRSKLGESLSSIRKFNKPLRDVTTPSLEALRAYTLGWRAMTGGDSSNAIVFYQRAISLDPNFAMAYAGLGWAYNNLLENNLAAENFKKAYALRDRVSEREKWFIAGAYDDNVTGDLLKAIQVYRIWARTYPRDPIPAFGLSQDYGNLGQFNQALAFARRTVGLAPDTGINYALLTWAYIHLDRLNKAAAVFRQARKHGADMPLLHQNRYVLAFLQGDTATMAREAVWGADKPGIEDKFLYMQARTAAYAGHLALAKDLNARAIASALKSGGNEPAAGYLAEEALGAEMVGDAVQARRQATAALKLSNAKEVEVTAALALALVGDEAKAQKLADDMARRFPQDTIVQFLYLPMAHSAIALEQNAPDSAISDLQAASPYELAVGLGPAELRGMAYLAEHQGAKAAAEFQKFLDHRALVPGDVDLPLAYLGLARARALSGDQAGARKAYQAFFTLWQHADPDIPILRQAQKEYARLE